MTNVTLIRGPKPTRVFTDATAQRAEQRACALADLHSTIAERLPNGDWRIDASAYYHR